MATRPPWDVYFSLDCQVIALRSVCSRHQFGAVVVNKRKRIISTGYNGPVKGAPLKESDDKKELFCTECGRADYVKKEVRART